MNISLTAIYCTAQNDGDWENAAAFALENSQRNVQVIAENNGGSIRFRSICPFPLSPQRKERSTFTRRLFLFLLLFFLKTCRQSPVLEAVHG